MSSGGRPAAASNETAGDRSRRTMQIGLEQQPFLDDHRLKDLRVVPGAVLLELALAAAPGAAQAPARTLQQVEFRRLLLVPDSGSQPLLAVALPGDRGMTHLRIEHADAARSAAGPYLTAEAPSASAAPPVPPAAIPPAALVAEYTAEQSGGVFYDELRQRGYQYGPAFRLIERLWLGDQRALGRLRAASDRETDLAARSPHPTLLDAAVQTLLAAAADQRDPRTLLLVGINEVRIYNLPAGPCWAQAEVLLAAAAGPADALVGDVRLLDEDGRVLVELLGVGFRALESGAGAEPAPPAVAIAATFTAEPLRDVLAFWSAELETPLDVVFAPYNQVFQQLLDSASMLARAGHVANVLLLRLEDWLPVPRPPRPNPDPPSDCNEPLARWRLPNGLEVVHLNHYETEYLYEEIFTRRAYLEYGVSLPPGAVVFDVGANIGLFTLFVRQECPSARVYAFEPSPHAFRALTANTSRLDPDVRCLPIGLGDHEAIEPFTVYPRSSVFSGFHADAATDSAALRTVVRNVLARRLADDPTTLDEAVDFLVQDRLAPRTVLAPVRTLSSVLREQAVERIDLLKIDVEKSELEVLNGIDDADWLRIGQIVLEVHELERMPSRVQHACALLEQHGFQVASHTEPLLEGTGLHTVVARRPRAELAPAAMADLAADHLRRSVDDLLRALETATERSSTPYLVCICPPSPAARRDAGQALLLERMAERLLHGLSNLPNVSGLGPTELLTQWRVVEPDDAHGDELGHIPYRPEFFAALGTAIARAVHSWRAAPYKVIALDGDQTLWSGVCGEDGPLGIRIDPTRQSLQAFMLRQRAAGRLLVLCSRNNLADVVATFEAHPEMPLRLDDFVARRVSWQPKSASLQALADELQLGLDSFVVVDDDPVECAEIEANCPGALVLRLPETSDAIPAFLDHVWAFDHPPGRTLEDARRSELYHQHLDREALRRAAPSFRSFLDGLHLEVVVAPATRAEWSRLAQLSQRTHQFNLSAGQFTPAELQTFAGDCLAVHVRDRFGDYGLVGAILLAQHADVVVVEHFLLSCRALGRGVEHRMLASVGQLALERGVPWVEVVCMPRPRNQPAVAFVQAIVARAAAETDEHPLSPRVAVAAVTGSPWRLRVPAAFVAALRFDPPERDTELRHTTPAVTAPAPPGPRVPGSQVVHVATNLREAGQIRAAVEAFRRRPRPTAATPAQPSGALEQALSSIWQEVLGVDNVGVDDNFFELGGTSLEAVLVISELKRRLDVDVSTVNFFAKTTIRSLADLLKHEGDRDWDTELRVRRARGSARRARQLERRRGH